MSKEDEEADLLFRLSGLLFKKDDSDLLTHGILVGIMARGIAIEMRLSEKIIENTLSGGMLHDIGKKHIRPELLSKKPLTKEEKEEMNQHCILGWTEAKKYKTLSGNICKIILQHHEKWNGRGYPNGLQGDQIRIEARIIAVADTFYAISKDRPYRPGKGNLKAARKIYSKAEIWFDPEVVKAFQKVTRIKITSRKKEGKR